MAVSLTTVSDVERFLSRDTGLSDQELMILDGLIPMVEGLICNYCGWNMLATDYTALEFDGNGLTELDLHIYPLNSLTTVVMDDEDITADITAGTRDGTIRFTDGTSVFTAGKYNVKVTFNAGFNPDNLPDGMERDWNALKYAANFLCATTLNRIVDGTMGIKGDKLKDATTEFDTNDIPILVKRVLDRFRLLRIL